MNVILSTGLGSAVHRGPQRAPDVRTWVDGIASPLPVISTPLEPRFPCEVRKLPGRTEFVTLVFGSGKPRSDNWHQPCPHELSWLGHASTASHDLGHNSPGPLVDDRADARPIVQIPPRLGLGALLGESPLEDDFFTDSWFSESDRFAGQGIDIPDLARKLWVIAPRREERTIVLVEEDFFACLEADEAVPSIGSVVEELNLTFLGSHCALLTNLHQHLLTRMAWYLCTMIHDIGQV